MNKLGYVVVGSLALAFVATTANAQETAQGQGGWVQSPQPYRPPSLRPANPADMTMTVMLSQAQQVAVYVGQSWEQEPAAVVPTAGDVDLGPQTGRGGLDNNSLD